MKNQPNKKTIGTFIVAGIVALLMIVALGLGLGTRGADRDLYVMYFHESIKGLSIGAPVVLNGVDVGKVVKIEIVPDVETREFTIPVYITFHDIQKMMPGWDRHWDEGDIVAGLIERGLHARLVNQNLLTGQLMIELDVKPAKTTLTGAAGNDVMEIPTALSSLSALSATAADIPIRDVVDNLNKTLVEFKDVLAPAVGVSHDFSRKAAVTLNNFNQAVSDISRAANAIRHLADFLEQHPESLIKGK
ncbi:MCE family protein [bacterium]|nr:MCE family protein [bacterium]